MHLSAVKINNFRKLESVELYLQPGLNLLVGENDSGKSAFVDAIRLALGTRDDEWFRLTTDDFFLGPNGRASNLRIECRFDDLDESEAGAFLEWLGIDSDDESKAYYLKIWLEAERKEESDLTSRFDRLIAVSHKAGPDSEGRRLDAEARELLRATYLKPLRDAERELGARRGSRLSQILYAHSGIKDQGDETTAGTLMAVVKEANDRIKDHPIIEDRVGSLNEQYLKRFTLSNDSIGARIDIARPSLRSILENLMLSLSDENGLAEDTPHGLGVNNLLFMAVELLLIQDRSLPLLLIEEPEAHLHPQLQMRLIEFLDRPFADDQELPVQVLITSHSPNVASKVDLEKLVLVQNGSAYSMASKFTKLDVSDYRFLRYFLDTTKANLFFARGMLMVEGTSEQILLPAIAECIGLQLNEYGVSIVNIGGTGFFRYARIFQRTDSKSIDIRIACVTDMDIPPDEAKGYLREGRKTKADYSEAEIEGKRAGKQSRTEGGPVRTFVSPQWTLEYDLALTCYALDMNIAVHLAWQHKRSSNVISSLWFGAVSNAIREFEIWQDEGKSQEQLASAIYRPISLDKVKKVEVAQQLATWFRIKQAIGQETADSFRRKLPAYLVDALDYVTRND